MYFTYHYLWQVGSAMGESNWKLPFASLQATAVKYVYVLV
jgi:hypothetical protein